jgi:hypothetical protein
MQEQTSKKKVCIAYWIDEETCYRLDRVTNRYGGRSQIGRNGLLKEIEYQEKLQGITPKKELLAS